MFNLKIANFPFWFDFFPSKSSRIQKVSEQSLHLTFPLLNIHSKATLNSTFLYFALFILVDYFYGNRNEKSTTKFYNHRKKRFPKIFQKKMFSHKILWLSPKTTTENFYISSLIMFVCGFVMISGLRFAYRQENCYYFWLLFVRIGMKINIPQFCMEISPLSVSRKILLLIFWENFMEIY